MYAFVLAVSGAVIIAAFSEFFLSDGEMKKYVKSVLSLVIVIMIITPILSYVSQNNFDLNINTDYSSQSEVYVDSAYITAFEDKRAKAIIDSLNEDFYKQDLNVFVSDWSVGKNVDAIYFEHINISTFSMVITSQNANIFNTEEIVQLVLARLVIDKNDIWIDGERYGG